MKEIKILFVGVGSIARRHIRNIYDIAKQDGFSICMDAYRRNFGTDTPDLIRNVYGSLESVSDDYDAIFITNPTEVHLETLRNFHDKGKHFFIEKPIVSLSQIEEAKKFVVRDSSVYYVACPLRYNAVIQWIKNNINPSDVISVRSISSSYLPDWRPGQDYRKTYSAHKAMGGGVSIDLIHEWDYLVYLFGWPERTNCFIGKKSTLEIDSDDYAIYIAEYSNMITELHLDYFGRKTIREIELICHQDTIIGDIANNRLVFLKTGKTIDFNEQRDDYQKRELKVFFDMIQGKLEYEDGYNHSIRVLELTQGR